MAHTPIARCGVRVRVVFTGQTFFLKTEIAFEIGRLTLADFHAAAALELVAVVARTGGLAPRVCDALAQEALLPEQCSGGRVRLEITIRRPGGFGAFAAALVDGGKVNVDDDAFFLASAVHDELLACAAWLRDDVFNLHMMLPKFKAGPVATFVPRVQQLVGCDAVIGKNNDTAVISNLINVSSFSHLGPSQAAVT